MSRLGILVALSGLCGCFVDTPGASCQMGTVTCPCNGDDTCDAGLLCEPSVALCIPENCTPGAENCPCQGGQCDAGLRCADGGLCERPGSTSAGSTTSPTTTASPTTTTSATAGSTTTAGATTDGPGPTAVVLYEGAVVDANLVGGSLTVAQTRDALDARCMPIPMDCTQGGHAFVSIAQGEDTIAMMQDSLLIPGNLPVVDVTRANQVAANFSALWSADLTSSLFAAGVTQAQEAWTGTNSAGGVAANCDGWSSDQNLGVAGLTSGSTVGWIEDTTVPCSGTAALLCVCW